jgi:site-specific DNA-methyltransferase (adenine-specific)
MFSSASDEWETPQEFFDALDSVFHFTLDFFATSDDAKCGRHFTKDENGLRRIWSGVCWMNPPYGRDISLWIKIAYESSMTGRTVVVSLLPSRTDARWRQDYVLSHATWIWFIRGRLRFSGKGSAPFPSALIVFGRAV